MRPSIASRSFALAALAAVSACLVSACGGSSSPTSAAQGGGAAVPADAPCTSPSGATFLVHGIAVGLVVDDTYVYTASTSGIMRAPRAGGATVTLTESASAVALSGDATSLYYFGSHPVGAPTPEGKVMSGLALYALPLAGGMPRLLLDGAYGMASVSDGTNLYWAAPGGVQQMPVAGGTSTTTKLEAGATVEALALGSDSLFMAVYAIAIGGGPVAGSIRRMPLAGGPVTTIVDHLEHPTALALDESRVYFTDAGSFDHASVRSAGVDGRELTTLANVVATGIAVDAHAVYYGTGDAIVKVDKASGTSSTLATGVRSPGNLVVRGGNLYWANASSGVGLSETNAPYGIMTACK